MAEPLLDPITIAICGPGPDACACRCHEGGECGHVFDGVEVLTDHGSSASCSRCGLLAIDHDVAVML